MTIHKRGGNYWDIWQECFFGSDNDTPMHMDVKYQVNVPGGGALTAVGFRCFDWKGAAQKNSQHSLSIEAM
jgi:hypothetical protein